MELFVDDSLVWDKVASAELEEDATQWPRQVLTELYRVLPEISEYTPEVKFMQVNEEQGYALGVVVVSNGTNSGLATADAGVTQAPKALIPVVVKNGKLSPIDTLMSSKGKMYPLTVERLREVLYRPESFELMTDDWGDSALWQLFAPPGSSAVGGAGGGGGGVQYLTGPGMGGTKMSMLEAIGGTVLKADVDRLQARLEESDSLKLAVVSNPFVVEAIETIDRAEPVSEKTASAYAELLHNREPIDVIFSRYDEDRDSYCVKVAARATGMVRTMFLDRGEYLCMVGEKYAAAADRDGASISAARSSRAVVVAGARGEKPYVAQSTGWFTVFDEATGRGRAGWVVPQLIDASGAQIPNALFFSNEGARVQEQIVGASSYHDTEDPTFDPPKGVGCFVVGRSGMDMHATVELRVAGSISTPDAFRYNCTDIATGEDVTVTLSRGQRGIVCFPDKREIVLPQSAGFVSTERTVPALVSQGAEVPEPKIAAATSGRIVVHPLDANNFRLELRHLPKLASHIAELSTDAPETMFGLCLAGLGYDEAYAALVKAANDGACTVYAMDLTSPPEVDTDKIAEKVAHIRSLRQDLLKEAAALPDAMTVDAVLSLDFINSENVRTFIAMIPYLEKALNKTCELVFASRLGLTEIPEAAAARAARGLNDAIRGLKALALRQIQELP